MEIAMTFDQLAALGYLCIGVWFFCETIYRWYMKEKDIMDVAARGAIGRFIFLGVLLFAIVMLHGTIQLFS